MLNVESYKLFVVLDQHIDPYPPPP